MTQVVAFLLPVRFQMCVLPFCHGTLLSLITQIFEHKRYQITLLKYHYVTLPVAFMILDTPIPPRLFNMLFAMSRVVWSQAAILRALIITPQAPAKAALSSRSAARDQKNSQLGRRSRPRLRLSTRGLARTRCCLVPDCLSATSSPPQNPLGYHRSAGLNILSP